MKSLILIVCFSLPSPDVVAIVAVGVGLQVESESPKPTPPQPADEKCSACDGTGKNGDGANARVCWKCGGDGKADVAAKERPLTHTPRVQCVIYTDSVKCAPCRALERNLRRLLVDDVKARNEQPWDVSYEESAHFRLVELKYFPKEFEKRGINTFPTIVFVVAGDEIPTKEQDPVKLALEYLRLLEEMKNQKRVGKSRPWLHAAISERFRR